MSSNPSPPDPQPSPSNATAPINLFRDFVPTREYRRFAEFCEACRHYRYIGLCYGAPGIGKTLSARRFSRAERVEKHDPRRNEPIYGTPIDTVFYTPSVVNTPAQVASEIRRACDKLHELATGPLRRRAEIVLDTIRIRNENYRRAHLEERGSRTFEEPPIKPTYYEAAQMFEDQKKAIPNPTRLVLIDEADRLRMTGLEQMRSIFDGGTFGLVFIGMPGIEKRMARYPQLYSRIGFVHEFRALGVQDMRWLLEQRWAPVGVNLSDHGFSEESAATLMRITGGNFRLLSRMLAQIERVLEINGLQEITKEVIEAARESLVIGQA
jgi:DNA transposition AAA+ family ATPase